MTDEVEELTTGTELLPMEGIPTFEGREDVTSILTKFTGAAKMEDAPAATVGDRLRVVGVYRVLSVEHLETKDGEIQRVQKLKPVELSMVPFVVVMQEW